MSQQQNIETLKRFGEAVNSGKLQEIEQLVAPGVVEHDPVPGQESTPQGYVWFFEKFRASFPDLNLNVDHMVADEENVAIAYTITGTHKGEFQGVSATGKRIKARGLEICRFEDGKIAERWGSSDVLGIMQQIGPGSA
ncbi:MAG: ester cyclase [Acidobacteriota bacterium]|nr:ester cyclase [Acidobacteriota bacterium]